MQPIAHPSFAARSIRRSTSPRLHFDCFANRESFRQSLSPRRSVVTLGFGSVVGRGMAYYVIRYTGGVKAGPPWLPAPSLARGFAAALLRRRPSPRGGTAPECRP